MKDEKNKIDKNAYLSSMLKQTSINKTIFILREFNIRKLLRL